MGISPDRFVPRQDGSPQSLGGLNKAGQGLGGGLLSGFTNLISGIGQALGSLFTGGLGNDHWAYPVYIGLRDSVQPLIDKNEELVTKIEEITRDTRSALTAAHDAVKKLQATERNVTTANNNANTAIQNARNIATSLDQTKRDFATKLSLANTKAIEALGKADEAFEKALRATNDAVRANTEFNRIQQEFNDAQAQMNRQFQDVDRAFDKTRVRFLVVPDNHHEQTVTLPGYVSITATSGVRGFSSKKVRITAQGNWTGQITGILKAKNGAADIVSVEVRRGQAVWSSVRGHTYLRDDPGTFQAGGLEFYVGVLLMIIPENVK